MSAGAVFKLIVNDGKADRMIMATKLLNQRIKDVMCARTSAGKADITPTLTDLERTHILYMNAHFKPFASIGFEYNKVRSQSGSASLGAGVTFSIPQFGDFFHDMVCNVRLSTVKANTQKTPLQGGSTGLNKVLSASNPFPDNTNSGTLSTSYNLVDAFGNVIVSKSIYSATPYSVNYSNLVRYCEFPGNRLFRSVKFDVNGNPLDQYDDMVPVMLEKFCTPPHKRAGYNRLVGQENPLTGYGGLDCAHVTDQDVINTPAGVITRAAQGQSNQTVALYGVAQLVVPQPPPGVSGAYTVIGSALASANNIQPLNPDGQSSTVFQNQFDVSRKRYDIMNGPHTPKPTQAPLEIWNKLRFWFNDDVRLSVPSVSIPFGQRFITIDLAPASDLIYEFPAVYLETIVDNINASNGLQLRTKTYSPLTQTAGINFAQYIVENIDLYINNIFVNPEIHDIYIKRIGFSLIRVYRQQRQVTDSSAGEILLSQLKWPIEYMFIGMRPKWNISSYNTNIWRDWHRLTRLVDATCDPMQFYAVSGFQESQPLAMVPNQGASVTELPFSNIGSYIGPVIPDNYYIPVPTVDSLALTSHGIVIFDNYSDIFYSSYTPFHYGGTSICTPDDVGALFVNMALFPRSYQPSGHLNVSRARESYIKWRSTYIDMQTPTELIIVGVALNFLLITDGSAVLRYST
jgi:hypothetical protein